MATSTIKDNSEIYEVTGGLTKVVFCRTGKIVNCFIGNIAAQTVSAWSAVKVADIPERFRPKDGFWQFITRQGATNTIPVYINATPEGILQIQNQSGTQYNTGAIMANSISWMTG